MTVADGTDVPAVVSAAEAAEAIHELEVAVAMKVAIVYRW